MINHLPMIREWRAEMVADVERLERRHQTFSRTGGTVCGRPVRSLLPDIGQKIADARRALEDFDVEYGFARA